MRLRNRKVIWLFLLATALPLLLWQFRGRRLAHPQFGEIHVQQDSTPKTPTANFLTALSDRLGISSPQWRMVGPVAGLKIGPAILGWSAKTDNDGYFYMADMVTWKRPLWEFAPTKRQRLLDVAASDLSCTFYGMDDPRGESVFGQPWMGEHWSGRTVVVSKGQTLLARLNTNRSTIYAIRIADQIHRTARDTICIEYFVATNQPPTPPP